MDSGFSVGTTRMIWNWMAVTVAQNGDCAKWRRTAHFKRINFALREFILT